MSWGSFELCLLLLKYLTFFFFLRGSIWHISPQKKYKTSISLCYHGCESSVIVGCLHHKYGWEESKMKSILIKIVVI